MFDDLLNLTRRMPGRPKASSPSSKPRRLSKAERDRRMARVKEAVDCSDYENPLKLSVALDRLLEHLK